MGYDMHYVTRPEGEAEAVAAARKMADEVYAEHTKLPPEEAGRPIPDRIRELGIDAHEAFEGRTERYARSLDKVDASYAAVEKVHRSYFRLNVWGMSAFRDVMFELGMAFDDDPRPPWPKIDDYGTSWDDVDAVEHPEDGAGDLSPERRDKAHAYIAATNEVLSAHGKADTPGIPIHKFGSNDGWIVLPVECEAAVRIWEEFVSRRGDEAARAWVAARVRGRADYWLEWITYLRDAVLHGGFEVN